MPASSAGDAARDAVLTSSAELETPEIPVDEAANVPAAVVGGSMLTELDRLPERAADVASPRVVQSADVAESEQQAASAATEEATAVLDPTGYVEAESEEIVERRTRYEQVFANPDGTETLITSGEVMHYPDGSGGWLPVDNRLSVDPKTGEITNGSNEWSVSFGPMVPGEGVRFEQGGREFSFEAVGVAGVSPVLEPDGVSVRYPEVAEDTDLVYRVYGGKVEEYIELKSPDASGVIDFEVSGLDLEMSEFGLRERGGPSKGAPSVPGSIDREAADRSTKTPAGVGDVQLSAPETFDAQGRAVPYDKQVFDVGEDRGRSRVLSVGVSREWLDAATPDQFPVVVDPTTTLVPSSVWFGSYMYDSYWGTIYSTYNDGWARTGNPAISGYPGAIWRTVVHLPYSQIPKGSGIQSAKVKTLNQQVTGSGTQPLYVSWASEYGPHYWVAPNIYDPWNVAGSSQETSWTGSRLVTGSMSSGSATQPAGYLNLLYNQWVYRGAYDGALLLQSAEPWGGYTLKKFGVQVAITYDRLVSNVSATASTLSGHRIKVRTTSAATDPDGSAVRYKHRITSSGGYSKTVYSSSNTYTTGPIGQQFWGDTFKYTVEYWGNTGGSHTNDPPEYLTKKLSRVKTKSNVTFPANQAPPTPPNPEPAAGAYVNSLTPTLKVDPVADPDGDEVWYYFHVCTRNAPIRCRHSAAQTNPQWTVPGPAGSWPGIRWNEPYIWGVVADDAAGGSTAPEYCCEFVAGRTPDDDVSLGAGWNPMSSDGYHVDPANGNLRYSMTDFSLSGVARSVDVVRTYNSLLKDLSGGFGPGWSFGWDMSVTTDGKGATVRYPDGRHEFHGKNPDGLYARPIGRSNVLTKNPAPGTTWRLTEPSGAFYDFDGSGRLIAMADTNGHQIESVWSGGGTTQTLTDASSGRSLTFTWSTIGSSTLITEVATAPVAAHGGPLSWKYYYNSGGRLAKACSPIDNSETGECWSYSYDGQGRLVSVTLPEGNVELAATYVASGAHQGKAATQTDGEGNTWQFQYSTVTLTPPGNGSTPATLRRTNVLDPRGIVAGDAAFNSQFYDFDELNRLTHHDDRHGAERWYAFDADSGYLSQVSYSTGDSATPYVSDRYEHDDLGNVTRHTDTRGKVYETDYGPLSRVTEERSPIAGRTDSYAYDAAGNKTSHTNGEGDTTTWTYTDGTESAYGEAPGSGLTVPPGLMASMTDPRGKTTTYEYSVAGELRLHTEPTGATTEYMYDELGRTVSTTVGWDGHVATTTETYDELARVVERTEPAVSNALTGESHQLRTSFVFDGNSNTTLITESDIAGSDPDRVTAKEYDDNDREWRVTDPEGGVIEAGFDEVGNVTTRTDQLGRVHVTEFDHARRPIRETLLGYSNPADPQPARDVVIAERTFDVRGRVISETDANGNETRHAYNNTDQVLATTLFGYVPPGASGDFVVSSFEYDDAGRLLAEESGNGKARVEYVYDLADRATQETIIDLVPGHVTSNRVTTRDYDAAGNLVREATAQAGRTDEIRYTYSDGNEVLTTTIEGGGVPDRVTTTERSQLGEVVATTDSGGNRTDTSLDLLGRVIAVQSPEVTISELGQAPTLSRPTIETGYDTFGNATHVSDQAGNLTVAEFDRLDRRVSITHPSYTAPGSSTPIVAAETFEYDDVGNLVGRVDRRGHHTDYEFDSMNQIAIERQPAATMGGVRGQLQTRYDDMGNVVWQSRPEGQVATHTYDPLGRRTSTNEHVRNGGGTDVYATTWVHDGAGNIISTTAPTGDVTTQLWSPTGNLVEVVDPGPDPQNLPTTTYTYDVGDRVLIETDPAGRSTRSTYDSFGQLVEQAEHDASGVKVTTETYGYDAGGNRTLVTDGAGHATNFTYDAANRLTGVAQPTTSGQPDVTRSYGYDDRGLNTVIVDGNANEWYKTYNVWGLLETEVEPATAAHPSASDRTFTVSYDAGGLAISEEQPGGVTISRTYDDLGRLTDEDGGSAGGQRSFGYDLSGRNIAYSHPSGMISVSYNDRDQITDVTGPAGPSSFSYDANARMTSRTDASGTTTYSWTARNELYGMTDPLTGQARTYTWSPSGELTQIDYGNQLIHDYTYDGIGRLDIEELTTAGSTTWSAAYTYTADGNVDTKTIAGSGAAGAGTNVYTYDDADRLVSWTPPSATSVPYSYDGNGNRLSAGADTYTYDERNRLLTAAGVDFTWTAAGMVASANEGGNVTTGEFDGLGRMTRVGGIDFTYDSLDRIASREGVGFEYSGVESQPTADGTTMIARTPSGRVAALADGLSGGLHAVSDRHGDLTATITANGVLADSVAYDPYGGQIDRTGSSELMVGFQSHYTDPDSGLVDMGARWYLPWTATFISRDRVHGMLETPVSLNRYTYANNNPLTYWDPDGRSSDGHLLNSALERAWTAYTGVWSGGGRELYSVLDREAQRYAAKSPAQKLDDALRVAWGSYTQAEAERQRRVKSYGAAYAANPADPRVRADYATAVVEANFKTFGTAVSRDPADVNGDISPQAYKAVANPENDFPPELQWAAREIINQGKTDHPCGNRGGWGGQNCHRNWDQCGWTHCGDRWNPLETIVGGVTTVVGWVEYANDVVADVACEAASVVSVADPRGASVAAGGKAAETWLARATNGLRGAAKAVSKYSGWVTAGGTIVDVACGIG